MQKSWAVVVLLLATVLAGCAASTDTETNAPKLQVTSDTGGIRGVVLDERIVPVVGALVSLTKEKTAKTDAQGLFNFTGLKEGDYLLKVTKLGYESSQTTAHVTAGVADPAVVKIQIPLIPGFKASRDIFKLDGFYECGFAIGQAGRPFITDQCDMAVRTLYDGFNGTIPGYPLPRNVEQGTNTQFIQVAADVQSIVQQTYWEDAAVGNMMTTLSSTPISNDCDCSKTDYMFNFVKPGEVMRSDLSAGGATTYQDGYDNPHIFPAGLEVASRSFLNWESISTAQNLKFQVITVLFHNYEAQAGFDFAKIKEYPVPT